jgi:ATP-dependent exoDNAse (exonuclease V) alpha subunit
MVGTRQMERVLSHAAEVGEKVVLVGDPQQLQAIEAGAAFRSIHDRHCGAEISEVRHQRNDWQRDATRDLSTGRTGEAIHAYDSHGMVHAAETREQARDRMREAGDLDEDVRVTVERGERSFAAGDSVMFLQNERGLGVKNGTLGTIEQVSTQSMTVRTDDGRDISFDLKDYDRIDHGYAATIHKAQGMTVDRTHVLATPGMDAHGSCVALSRHRDGMDLHYGGDDFADQDRLARTLSRGRAKDMATDYEQPDPVQSYAERRGIIPDEKIHIIKMDHLPEVDTRRILFDSRSTQERQAGVTDLKSTAMDAGRNKAEPDHIHDPA